ncbi:MAG: nucleotidyltransferase domain-containing protein [Chloroflexota bacterium]|nr:nucleotidyltransferase domain-containing protein [Chloroflexota bacterium]
MSSLITDNLDAIRALGREYGVVRLEVFGSVCTDEFDPGTSDIDFLVEYPAGYDFGPWHANFHALRRALTNVLNHPVDLVDTWALRDPRFSTEAAKTRQVLYDASHIAQTA